MIDLWHLLAGWAKRMPWGRIAALLMPTFAHQRQPGKVFEKENRFGPSREIAAAASSAAGRPRRPVRQMAALRGLPYFCSDIRVFWRRMGLVLLLASWNYCAADSPAISPVTAFLSPGKIVRQAVVEHLLQGDESLLKREIVIRSDDAKAVKDLVRYRLDPGLLKSGTVSAFSFVFTKPGAQDERSVATWVITYWDKKTAQRMSELPVMKSDYFRRTKILTLFSSAVVDRHLVIVFTENSGDEDIVRLIKSIPEYLDRQQKQE
jgi:hypothetical protein